MMETETSNAEDFLLRGYDGFGQLSASFRATSPESLKVVPNVLFSWTNCLLFCKSEGADHITYLAGLFDQKKMQLEKLEIPGEEDNIINGSINSRSIIALTKKNRVWRFTLSTKKWDDITPILFAEQSESLISSEEAQIEVQKIAGSEGMNVALLSNGVILNIPNVISGDTSKLEIVEIAVGLDHAVFLSKGGLVFTYGSGGRGQLGHGELENEEVLREVRALSGIQISQVAAAGWHSVVRSYCGDLYGWGWNNWGQLSISSGEENQSGDFKGTVIAEPTLMTWPKDDVNVAQVACGTRHTVALLDDGSAWGCGSNAYNQLPGLDFNKSSVYPSMMQLRLPNNRRVKKVVCGAWNSAFWFA